MCAREREGRREKKKIVKDGEKEEERAGEMCGCPSGTLESWWVG